jgi:hypothetical protein
VVLSRRPEPAQRQSHQNCWAPADHSILTHTTRGAATEWRVYGGSLGVKGAGGSGAVTIKK